MSGKYTVNWRLYGDAFDTGLVEITTQSKDHCIINVKETPSELKTFSLNADIIRGHDSGINATISKQIDLYIAGVIMSKKSNPKVLSLCYSAGWCASQEYMTETEAQLVTSLGTTFKQSNITEFPELQYFTGLTEISDHAFFYNTYLTNIILPEGITRLGSYSFHQCLKLRFPNIPDSVVELGSYVFDYCYEFEVIDIPDSITSIGSSCFASCNKLTEIKLPKNLTIIPNSIFNSCNSLKSIKIPDSVIKIENNAFSYCKLLTDITLPKALQYVYYNSFNFCENLVSITLPKSATIKTDTYSTDIAFTGCQKLEAIYVDEDTTGNLYSVDGILFSKLGNQIELVKYPPAKLGNEYIVPEEVTLHNTGCFAEQKFLEKITLSNLSNYIFNNCPKLNEVILTGQITMFPRNSFYGCTGLTSIEIPNTVETIGDSCFSRTGLISIDIPDSVISLGEYCFLGSENLKVIKLSSKLTSLPYYFAKDCSSLTSIDIPDSITSLGYGCFNNTGFSSIPISDVGPNISTNGSSFENCKNLTTVIIPDRLIISSTMFKGCTGLTSIKIPKNITTIPEAFIRDCSSLTSIEFSENITLIDRLSLIGCSSLSSISISRAVAPKLGNSEVFGDGPNGRFPRDYTGRNTYDQGINILYVPAGATGYDTGQWLDPLQDETKCGFTISYTL